MNCYTRWDRTRTSSRLVFTLWANHRLCRLQKWKKSEDWCASHTKCQEIFRDIAQKITSLFNVSQSWWAIYINCFNTMLNHSTTCMKIWNCCLQIRYCSCWQSLWRIVSFEIMRFLKRSKQFLRSQMGFYIIFESRRTCFVYLSFRWYLWMNQQKKFKKQISSMIAQWI